MPPFPSRARREEVFKEHLQTSADIACMHHLPLEELAQKLKSSCPGDLELVDAVYTLITTADTAKIDIADEETAADYLLRSQGDKHVMLGLFQKLLAFSGIQCEIIRGYAKGGGYNKSRALGHIPEPNHHWLGIIINGNWHLIDLIWCCQQKTDFYYLTDPDLFVITHLPLESKWQLLHRPVTVDEFFTMAAVQQSFTMHGLQLVDQLTSRLSCSTGEEKFCFAYRNDGPNKEFSYKFVLEKKTAALTSVSGHRLDRCLLIEKQRGYITYTFYFPAAGEYRIDILCKDAAAPGFSNVVTYYVSCKKAFPRLKAFPENDIVYWGPSDKSHSFGLEPISHPSGRVIVQHGGSEQIILECPESLALEYDLNFETELKYNLSDYAIDYYEGTQRHISVLLPEVGFYVLGIYAYFSEEKKPLACRYLLECTKAYGGGAPRFLRSSCLGHQPIRRALLDGIEKRSIVLLRKATTMAKESRYVNHVATENATAVALLGQLERLDKIKSDVLKENKTVISEVRSYSKPPTAVHDMLNACILLLGECEIPYVQWVDLQKKCGNTGNDGLGKRLQDLDFRTIHPEMAARARQIIEGYKQDAVSKATPTAALFHAWVWGMCQEVLIGNKHFTKPADLARQKEIVRQLRKSTADSNTQEDMPAEGVGQLDAG